MTLFVISLAIGLGGGIYLEYQFSPLAWVMGKYRKAVAK